MHNRVAAAPLDQTWCFKKPNWRVVHSPKDELWNVINDTEFIKWRSSKENRPSKSSAKWYKLKPYNNKMLTIVIKLFQASMFRQLIFKFINTLAEEKIYITDKLDLKDLMNYLKANYKQLMFVPMENKLILNLHTLITWVCACITQNHLCHFTSFRQWNI